MKCSRGGRGSQPCWSAASTFSRFAFPVSRNGNDGDVFIFGRLFARFAKLLYLVRMQVSLDLCWGFRFCGAARKNRRSFRAIEVRSLCKKCFFFFFVSFGFASGSIYGGFESVNVYFRIWVEVCGFFKMWGSVVVEWSMESMFSWLTKMRLFGWKKIEWV